jgi:mannitol/fructose-specific phosphotransferase system IIA component (Ntr-type)
LLRISDIVAPGAIVAQLAGNGRDEVIAELVDALIASGGAVRNTRDELIARVLEREKKGSTGFGRGVAVPHVKHPSVTKMTAAVGLSVRGVDFNALDRQPVYSVFLLLSPDDRPEDHLQAMEAIFKNLSKESFRRFLRQASTADEIRSLFEEADGQHMVG